MALLASFEQSIHTAKEGDEEVKKEEDGDSNDEGWLVSAILCALISPFLFYRKKFLKIKTENTSPFNKKSV